MYDEREIKLYIEIYREIHDYVYTHKCIHLGP
jgi:hypothetical protein